MRRFPKHIAICGFPRAGKTEVQKILLRDFDIMPIDDAVVLRRAALALYGLNEEDVNSVGGKDRIINVCGREWTVRQLLGRLGDMMESEHGDFFMPERAVAEANALDALMTLDHGGTPLFENSYSYGSVRKNQGAYYKRLGGVVIQVCRPGIGSPDNAFDLFDTEIVDAIIMNEGSLDDLSGIVRNTMKHIEMMQKEAA